MIKSKRISRNGPKYSHRRKRVSSKRSRRRSPRRRIAKRSRRMSPRNRMGSIRRRMSQRNTMGSIRRRMSQRNTMGSIRRRMSQRNTIARRSRRMSPRNRVPKRRCQSSKKRILARRSTLGRRNKRVSCLRLRSKMYEEEPPVREEKDTVENLPVEPLGQIQSAQRRIDRKILRNEFNTGSLPPEGFFAHSHGYGPEEGVENEIAKAILTNNKEDIKFYSQNNPGLYVKIRKQFSLVGLNIDLECFDVIDLENRNIHAFIDEDPNNCVFDVGNRAEPGEPARRRFSCSTLDNLTTYLTDMDRWMYECLGDFRGEHGTFGQDRSMSNFGAVPYVAIPIGFGDDLPSSSQLKYVRVSQLKMVIHMIREQEAQIFYIKPIRKLTHTINYLLRWGTSGEEVHMISSNFCQAGSEIQIHEIFTR